MYVFTHLSYTSIQTLNARVEFRYTTDSLIGDEDPVLSNLRLVIPDDSNNVDIAGNNERSITFTPTAIANLRVTV